jgi:hypothetical protein
MARTWKKLTPGSSASGELVPPDAVTTAPDRALRLRAGATHAERVLDPSAFFIIADRRAEREGAAAAATAAAAMDVVARDMALDVM